MRTIEILVLAAAGVGFMGCNGAAPGNAASATAPKTTSTATTATPSSSTVTPLPAVTGPDHYLYFGQRGVNGASPGALAIDSKTGALAPIGSDLALSGLNDLVMDPGRHFLATSSGTVAGTGFLAVYRPTPATGTSTVVGAAPADASSLLPGRLSFVGQDRFVVIDMDGLLQSGTFVPQTGSIASVAALSVDASVPAGNVLVLSVAVSGDFVYVAWADWRDARNLGGGALTLDETTPSRLTVFHVDAKAGLTLVATTPETFQSIVFADPTGKFVYLASKDGVTTGTPDPKTGALRSGAMLPLGGVTPRLVFAPSGSFAYAIAAPSPALRLTEITALAIDPKTGALTPGAKLSLSTSDASLVIERSGTFAFVTVDATQYTSPNPSSYVSEIQPHRIDPTSGALTAVGAPFTVTGPRRVEALVTTP